MKWEVMSQHSLRWTFRLIEWITLAIAFGIFFLDDFSTSAKSYWVLGCYPLLFLLSLEFPIHRSRLQQRLYLAAQMILAIIPGWFSSGLDQYFFLILIKACILLARKEVILWAIVTGIVYLCGAAWWIFFVDWNSLSPYVSFNMTLSAKWRAFLTLLMGHIGLTVYVLLLGFFVAAERRSRQQAEQLTQEVQVLAAQVERSRIARDIHDSLGHSLVALGVQLEVAQKMTQKSQNEIPAKLQHAVKMSKQLADDCLHDVRRSLHSLRDSNLNFQQAIEQFIQTLFVPTLKIESTIHLPILPATLNNQLYFILKEGLMNIQKHAHASKVMLHAEATDEEILLTLMDNGCGFDLQTSATGMGIESMGDRARLIGGELTIESTIGQGTTLHVRIPR